MTRKITNALSTLRQLAALGLPPAVVFGDMIECLKDVVPFESATIVLLNEDYSARDGLATFDLPPPVAKRYVDRWFNLEEEKYYPSHLRLQSAPSLRVMQVSNFSPKFGETEIYDEVLSHAEHHWIAGLTCRDGSRPIGNLGMGRPGALRDFTREDLALLDQARPYVSQTLGARDGPVAGEAAGTVEVAMLCADASGAVLSESPNAWRLLRWAREVPLDEPAVNNLVYAWARPLLAELSARVHAALTGGLAAPAVMRTVNRYGQFVLRAYALTPTSAGVSAGVGVQVERRLPMSVRLFRSREFRALSNRERAVAQGLIAGASHSEIAGQMGVSPSTVVSHVRNLYARLEVRHRQGLVSRLLNPLEAGPA